MTVGTRIHIKARLLGLQWKFESQVTAWDEGHLMRMTSRRPKRPTDVVTEHRFEPDPDGTRYTWGTTTMSNTIGGGAVGWLFCRLMNRNAQAQQQRFKIAMESTDRP